MSFIFIITLIITLSAQPPERPESEKSAAFRERKLTTIHFLKMEEELELTEEQSEKLLPVFRSHRGKLHKLHMKRMKTIREMIDLCHQNRFDESQSQDLMKSLTDIDQQIEKNNQSFRSDIKSMLSPKQYLQFIIFEATFAERIREILNEMRPHHPRPEEINPDKPE